MPDQPRNDVVQSLHRAAATPGMTADLRGTSPERAATILVDEFARTAYAEARVANPRRVRELIRRDCRRRGLTVKTLSAGATVVAIDEARHERWLQTEDGQQYARQRDAAEIAVLEAVMPKTPRTNPLRPVD